MQWKTLGEGSNKKTVIEWLYPERKKHQIVNVYAGW